MRKPILTLTTDFGLTDHYVGAMKGVILGICPQAQIVDITHGVTPFEIAEGAYTIAQAYRHFSTKTVHVVVVDPGVGSDRRPILAESAGQYFVAPDNGVLSMVLAGAKHKVRQITNDAYFHHPVSRTFHGRDIFAPVGAHVAAGVAASRIGKLISDCVKLDFDRPQANGPRSWIGRILKVDRFGNLITNFRERDFGDLPGQSFSLAIGQAEIRRVEQTYAEAVPGELFVIAGSSGYWEVSVNQGSAAKLADCRTGSFVELTIQ